MKHATLLFVLLSFVSSSPKVFGQSPFELELVKLKAQKEKAVASALAPIEQRYREELDRLLRKASQAGDFQAALKIKSEFGRPAGVPTNAVEFGGKWYSLYPERITWTEARQKCKSLGGNLASVLDETTHNFIKSIAPQVQLWLGATDEKSEGKWRWENTLPMEFSSWFKGEPSGGRQENCMYVVDSHWRDASSTEKHGFICEWTIK